jgi:hypothetical protein
MSPPSQEVILDALQGVNDALRPALYITMFDSASYILVITVCVKSVMKNVFTKPLIWSW